MTAPVLAVGDGPLGFCKPLRETFPEITKQRYVAQDGQCARSAAEVGATARQGRARRDLERRRPRPAVTPRPAADYGAKWAKAVAKITDDLDVLLAFF